MMSETKKVKPTDGIVIGNRIAFGGIVGAAVSFGVWAWNLGHPDSPVPAEQAVALTTVLTGIGQVILVNVRGISVPE